MEGSPLLEVVGHRRELRERPG